MNDILLLVQLVGLGLIMMLPVANPSTSMTLLLSLGRGIPREERTRQVNQAAVYVVLIMLITYYAGAWILHAFGISIPGVRIAGGLIVAFIGFNMLFPSSSVSDIPEADNALHPAKGKRIPNIALVPLALPGTAGPGTLALVISAASKIAALRATYPDWVLVVAPLIVALLLGVLFLVCLRSADRIVAIMGQDGVDAMSRVMGFLLVCMAVQFVIDGVLDIVRHAGV